MHSWYTLSLARNSLQAKIKPMHCLVLMRNLQIQFEALQLPISLAFAVQDGTNDADGVVLSPERSGSKNNAMCGVLAIGLQFEIDWSCL